MGPTWALSAPDGPHIGPMNLAIRDMYAPYTMMHHVMDPQYVIFGKYYHYHDKKEMFEHNLIT